VLIVSNDEKTLGGFGVKTKDAVIYGNLKISVPSRTNVLEAK